MHEEPNQAALFDAVGDVRDRGMSLESMSLGVVQDEIKPSLAPPAPKTDGYKVSTHCSPIPLLIPQGIGSDRGSGADGNAGPGYMLPFRGV